ncbi:MAG TPA: ABC transporter ATP-binding protein [Nocardioidaceae bacterium]|nr:ABC transporter ATP-binding protein [Nocardioidaceae bacterium]
MTSSITATSERGEPEPSSVLGCRGLRRCFGELVAVDDVSFSVAAGETYGLLGPNGAGKTTIISVVAGVLEADAGQVLIDGVPMRPAALDVKSRIGYVPQDIALYPDLSGEENLRFFAALYRLPRELARSRVAEVLDVVGLTDRAKDQVKKYSGGMKRRLNIAVGLVHRPRLLILDEPTVGVDPQSRNAILDSIERLSAGGMAVLYTTHYMEEAERLCDRVGILDLGHLIAEGRPRDLTARLGAAEHIVITVDGDVERAQKAAETLSVVSGSSHDETDLDVLVRDAESALPAVMEAVRSTGCALRSVTIQEPDLEAVFLHLTGKRLRD